MLTFHLSRLRTAPTLHVLARQRASTRVAIDGLVCGVCAMRTRTALATVPGVRAVRVDLAAGTAEVEHEAGIRVDEAALRRALASVIVAAGLRRALARICAWRGWLGWTARAMWGVR